LLPVSGVTVVVREPTGEDELFIVETPSQPLPAMLELSRRVVRAIAGAPLDWPGLPASDLDAAALAIRRAWIGDTIRTDTVCAEPGCGERIDVSFGIQTYIDHHRPRRPRGVVATTADGWFTLAGSAARFRIPTIAHLLGATSSEDPAQALARDCVDSAGISRPLARRLDRALAALAPRLDGLIGGTCPACGHELTLRFDPLTYTLRELRDVFSGIHLETHALASEYGWPEATILALPRGRRRRYASIVAGERAAA
jgi:hypothetical protein